MSKRTENTCPHKDLCGNGNYQGQMGITWWPSGQDSALSLLRVGVQSLVGEVRSCKPYSLAKRKKEKRREREKKKRLIHKCSKKHFPKVDTTQTSIDDEKINKMWYIHTIEYHLAIKKNEGLIHSTTCMNLRNTVLSQRSQMQKTHTAWFHLHEMSR